MDKYIKETLDIINEIADYGETSFEEAAKFLKDFRNGEFKVDGIWEGKEEEEGGCWDEIPPAENEDEIWDDTPIYEARVGTLNRLNVPKKVLNKMPWYSVCGAAAIFDAPDENAIYISDDKTLFEQRDWKKKHTGTIREVLVNGEQVIFAVGKLGLKQGDVVDVIANEDDEIVEIHW